MPIKVGELYADLRLNSGQFTGGMAAGRKGLAQFATSLASATGLGGVFGQSIGALSEGMGGMHASGLLAAGAVAAITAGLAALSVTGVRVAEEMEEIQIGFNQIAGTETGGFAMVNEWENFADSLGMELPVVAAAGKQMMNLGNSAEITKRTIAATANAMRAMPGTMNLDSVIKAFARLKVAGELGRSVMQLSAEGINVYEYIGAAVGKTAEEVRKLAEASQLENLVPGPKAMLAIIKGLEEKFGNGSATAEWMKTLAGIVFQVVDALEDMARTVGQAVLPVLTTLGGGLRDLVVWFKDLSIGTKQIGLAAIGLAVSARPLVGVFTSIKAAIAAMGFTSLQTTWTGFVAAIRNTAPAAQATYTGCMAMAAGLRNVSAASGGAYGSAMRLTAGLQATVAGSDVARATFVRLGATIKAAGASLLNFIGSPTTGALIALAAVAAAVMFLKNMWDNATDAIAKYEAKLAGVTDTVEPAKDKAGRDRQLTKARAQDSQLNNEEANAARRYQEYKADIGNDPTPGMLEQLASYAQRVMDIQEKRKLLHSQIEELVNTPFEAAPENWNAYYTELDTRLRALVEENSAAPAKERVAEIQKLIAQMQSVYKSHIEPNNGQTDLANEKTNVSRSGYFDAIIAQQQALVDGQESAFNEAKAAQEKYSAEVQQIEDKRAADIQAAEEKAQEVFVSGWMSTLTKQLDAMKSFARQMADAMRQETADIVSILKDRAGKTLDQEKSRYEKMAEMGNAGYRNLANTGGSAFGDQSKVLNPTYQDIFSAALESRSKNAADVSLNNQVSGALYGNALPAYDSIANMPALETLNKTGAQQLGELQQMRQAALETLQYARRAAGMPVTL